MKVKGIELMQMIADGKIKEGTRINIIDNGNPYKFYTIVGVYRCLHIWREEIGKEDTLLERVLDTEDLLTKTFEILEDKTEEIEEIDTLYSMLDFTDIRYCKGEIDFNFKEMQDKINELVRAYNSLIKQDTSKETNCMTD